MFQNVKHRQKQKLHFRTNFLGANLPSDSASSIMERPGKNRRTWCSSSIAATRAAHSLPVPLAERPPRGLPMSSSSSWSWSHASDTEDSGAGGATSKKLTRRRCRRPGEAGRTTPCGGWTARVTRRIRDGGGLVSSSRVASSRNRSSTCTTLNVMKKRYSLTRHFTWRSEIQHDSWYSSYVYFTSFICYAAVELDLVCPKINSLGTFSFTSSIFTALSRPSFSRRFSADCSPFYLSLSLLPWYLDINYFMSSKS